MAVIMRKRPGWNCSKASPLGCKVILGIDTNIRTADNMRYNAQHYGVLQIHKTLEGCLKERKNHLTWSPLY